MQRRSALLLAAVLMAVSFALPAYSAEGAGTLDDCIRVDIGELMANPGEDIMVPIYISETTGWGVMAFEMTICWCDLPFGLLQYEGCQAGPVLRNTGGWVPPACGPCGGNCITIASAGTNPLVGAGPLMYLNFHVSANAKPCMCCEIWFTDIKLYDPEDPLNVCQSGGEVCIEWCTVGVGVSTWWCDFDCGEPFPTKMLPGVRTHLSRCGEPIETDYTDQEGMVIFDCLEPLDEQDLVQDCGYCVEVDYCPIPRDWINAFDAALILKYLVCMDDLDCCSLVYCEENQSIGGEMVYPQRLAADVNCTGVITAYDASLILQYVVGLLPAFPCPDPWAFMMAGDCEECQYNCPASFFFVGILKGDVSGDCYVCTETFAAPTATVKVGVPQHFDGYVEVPVGVKHADNVFSTQFELAYNADDFDVTQVRGIGLASGMMTAYNADNGNLLIAMAGSGSFSGSGDVAIVTLQKKHTPIPVASTRLEIVGALLNESAPMIEDHQYDSEVVRFALGPVSPNPFTEAAVISFSAPRASGVSIDVYDVHGRLVQTVLSGQVEAGTHQVTWDGCDSSGSKVARGVYFCRMNAGEFNATEKMVMLQ